jgi:hypothetical protein
MSDATDDAFTAALALLAAAADPARCRAHLLKLRRLEKRIGAAQAKLDAAAERHAAVKAELAESKDKVIERERIVADWEAEAAKRGELEKFPFDPNFAPGTRSWSGLARAPTND